MSLKGNKKIIFLLILFSVAPALLSAQNAGFINNYQKSYSIVSTAVPFLMISPDARSSATGESGVASSADVNSVYWNPSKLAYAEKKIGVAVSYAPWLKYLSKGNYLAYLAGYYKIDKLNTLSSSFRYFSLGKTTLIDVAGKTANEVKPTELAFDIGYTRKLSKSFSAAVMFRYIQSDLFSGIPIAEINSKIGKSLASDISMFYRKEGVIIGGKECIVGIGLNISNIGPKISYMNGQQSFIPTNLRLGASFLSVIDEYNKISFTADVNKLMVPSAPLYKLDNAGFPEKDLNGNYIILKGKDPNRSLTKGMIGSFNDAPGGFKEELKEITTSIGFEYTYANQFIVRAGYFNEDISKGNRKNMTIGMGIKSKKMGVDVAYLIPLQRLSPLTNTFRVTLYTVLGK